MSVSLILSWCLYWYRQCYCAVWGWGSRQQSEAATLKAAVCLTHKTTHLVQYLYHKSPITNTIWLSIATVNKVFLLETIMSRDTKAITFMASWRLSPRPRLLWHSYTECLQLYSMCFVNWPWCLFLMLLSTLYESIFKATKQELPASDSDNWK